MNSLVLIKPSVGVLSLIPSAGFPIHFPMQRTDPVQRSRPNQEQNGHDDAMHERAVT